MRSKVQMDEDILIFVSFPEIISRKDDISMSKIKVESSRNFYWFDGFLAPISINFRIENKILNWFSQHKNITCH